MPFFEVFDFAGTPDRRGKATRLMTKALEEAYGIGPEIISAYFIDVSQNSYGHEGAFPADPDNQRIFVKVHAFRRPDNLRRIAARTLTDAVAEAYEAPPKNVAVYFFDRDPDQVSHAGLLASD
jgi:phenylpyruvate tautomerase PptA (4-oxalocrotonate tautomerase family)